MDMDYRERIRLYQQGKLAEEERKKLEEEIEKHEAISDYLYEKDEIPRLDELLEKDKQKEPVESGEAFIKLINRSIRRAFVKLGVTVFALTMIVVLLVQFVLPGAVSTFFYDPGKDVGCGQNQLSRDMSVYADVMLPCSTWSEAAVQTKGYGKYDFTLSQTVSFTGRFSTVSGEIIKNRLKLYNENLLQRPIGNNFVWSQVIGDLSKPVSEGAKKQYHTFPGGDSKQEMKSTLEKLSEDTMYIGYVSLEQMMDYEQFVEYMEEKECAQTWCGVKTGDISTFFDEESGEELELFHADGLGFTWEPSFSTTFQWDQKAYPELFVWNSTSLWEENERVVQAETRGETPEVSWEDAEIKEESDYGQMNENIRSEAYMRKHFISQLNYLADQKEFSAMLEYSSESLREAAEYVEQNGITVYGFAALMKKDTMLELLEEPEIYGICADAL